MTAHALQTYRQKLQSAAARLAAEVTTFRAEALRPTGSGVGGTADGLADPGEQAAEEQVALALLGAEGRTLAEVNAAFVRIDRGTYGRCEGCDQPIGRPRLDILPHARLCIRCARAAG